jgi:pseudouridylate synthase
MNETNYFPKKHIVIHPEVARAISHYQAVVALESTVITHGLPRPENLDLARSLEQQVRANNAMPATIAVLNGKIHIGLDPSELELLSSDQITARKISRRDFGIAIARNENGGTTVAGTLIAAHLAGIKVFATGGIGGVHRNANMDISADLPELGRTPLIVVCSGAKAILDLPATREVLETSGVPVIGYQTDEFPAFYSASSGLPVDASVDTPQEVARIAAAHWEMGLGSAILVVVPPPPEFAIPAHQLDAVINQALAEAAQKHIQGAGVTPFLLNRVSELSGKSSLRANLALLRNNARIAALIASAMIMDPRLKLI